MIKGKNVLLKLAGQTVAAQTDLQMQAEVEMVQIVPLPGSSDADWAHFEKGSRVWGLTNSSFYVQNDVIIDKNLAAAQQVNIEVNIGSKKLTGSAVILSTTLQAQMRACSMLSIQMEGNDWPVLQ